MDDYRHYHIVLVPVPFKAGVDYGRPAKPGKYPYNRREPWRPATRPPSKAAATVNLLRNIVEQEAGLREFLQESRRRAAG